jgi:hypothetical protein
MCVLYVLYVLYVLCVLCGESWYELEVVSVLF